MPRLSTIVLGAAFLLPVGASASAQQVENGYPVGSLAVAAIERQDWATAEKLLTEGRHLRRSDPARLINLATVYVATGRQAEAVDLYRRALEGSRHEQVETRAGVVTSTDAVARAALRRYASFSQTAAR